MDEYGFPIPQGFDDEPQRKEPVSGPVIAAIVVMVAAVGVGVVLLGPTALDEAEKWLRQLQLQGRRHTQSPEAYLGRAQLHIRNHRWDQALRDCDRFIELAPNEPRGYLLRAAVYSEQGRYPEAIADYDRVLELNPNHPVALNNRAYTRALAKVDLQEALEDVSRAIAIGGPNAAYLDTRGYLYFLLDRPEQALPDLEEAVRRAGEETRYPDEMAEIIEHRGLVYRQLGREEEARQDLDRARRLRSQFRF